MARINFPNKLKPFFENKIKAIRRMYAPKAPRANRPGHKHINLAAVILITGAALGSFFLPKDDWQLIKEKLIANPDDFQLHVQLAEKLLADRRFDEAEKELLLAQEIGQTDRSSSPNQKVLGLQSQSRLEELWQEKHYNDPKDVQQLIVSWEKIVEEKPNYPDAYLQLTLLYLKSDNSQKASENLKKALDLDPGNQEAKQLQEILKEKTE